MNKIIMFGTIAILILLLLMVAIAYVAISRKNDKATEDAIFLTSKKVHYDYWYNMYATLDSIKITKNLINRLYRQYEILDPGDEKLVKEKAVKTVCMLLGMDFFVFFAVLIMTPNLFTILAALWFLYNATNMIVNQALQKQELELQKGFNVFISEVRHNYFKHGMVDEAIYETFDKLTKQMQSHAMLVYKTITAKDMDEALRKYSDCAPNIYMKQFVSICATTMKYGDKVVNNQSLFLADLKDLKQTMDDDLLRKQNSKAKFSGMTIIVMLPVFALDFIKNWAISVVGSLQKFYNGKYGIMLSLGAFVISLVIMLTINYLKNGKQVDRAEHPVLEFLLSLRPIARFVHNYEEYYHSKTYKLRMLLKKTGSSMTTSTMLLKRLIQGAVAFVACLILFISLNTVQVNLTLNDVREVADKGSGTSDYVNVSMMALTSHYVYEYMNYDLVDLFNNEVSPGANVRSLNEGSVEMLKAWLAEKIGSSAITMTNEELLTVIRSYNTNHSADTSLATVCYGDTDNPLDVLPDDELTRRKVERDFNRIMEMTCEENGLREAYIYEIIADCVYAHVKDYQDASFKWWYVLVAMLAAVAFYQLPVIVLKVNEKELQDFMEDEVIQFQSIIMILMHIDQMTVGTILEEMEKFAFCFADSIQKCINHLPSGEEQALTQLTIDEPFEPFVRLVENLMSCDRIGIKQAFNEIDIERQNYIEKRKQEGEIKLNNKAATAQFLAFAPISFIIGFYMVVPFVVEAMSSLTDQLAGR